MFYGYPAALTAEHHFALNDQSETKGKTYLKLFDFNFMRLLFIILFLVT